MHNYDCVFTFLNLSVAFMSGVRLSCPWTPRPTGHCQSSVPSAVLQEFDTSAAFFNVAVSKKKKGTGRQTEPQSPARQKAADIGDTEDTVSSYLYSVSHISSDSPHFLHL